MATRTIYTIVLGALCCWATPIQAQDSQGTETTGSGEATAGVEGAAAIRKASDASVDRGIIMPAAETISRGDLTFNSYELVLAGLTYGFTDSLQLSLTTLLPITEDIPFFLMSALKFKLVSTDRLVFSLQPTASIGIDSGGSGDAAGTVGVSALLDLLLDSQGKLVLSFSEMNLWAWGGGSGSDIEVLDGMLFQLGVGFNARVHKNIKLMLELVFHGGIINGEADVVSEATAVTYGVRFFGDTIAVDLAFIRPIDPDVAGPFIMGVPLVTFSARF